MDRRYKILIRMGFYDVLVPREYLVEPSAIMDVKYNRWKTLVESLGPYDGRMRYGLPTDWKVESQYGYFDESKNPETNPEKNLQKLFDKYEAEDHDYE